jgi:exodeoxyribonuclease VII small subunit
MPVFINNIEVDDTQAGVEHEHQSGIKDRDMETLTFEEAFAQLEAAVAALQDGQMPLEQALHHYEEGMKLAQYCNDLLQKAELRVQQLRVNDEGAPVMIPFEAE